MTLNKRLKKLRNDRGISVYRLSTLSDVSQNYIRAVEKGKSQPSVYILTKLLKPLGMSLSEFFRDYENILFPSPYEKKLIYAARRLNEHKSEILLALAEALGEDHRKP